MLGVCFSFIMYEGSWKTPLLNYYYNITRKIMHAYARTKRAHARAQYITHDLLLKYIKQSRRATACPSAISAIRPRDELLIFAKNK